jgi:serine/threonine-protein kinase
VWVADHLALQTHVAVKLIDPELAKREDARERFKREATAAAQLRSAHVVQILDHGIDDTQPFIVMELLDGEDLFERLNTRGRLPLRETSRIITQVARALTRAHQAGIVHRDLKPENVFLVPNDDDEIAKVLDFGVAKVSDPAKQTMRKTGVGTLVGTPHYMSPEQVKGIGEVDSKSDLWSLGVIAFQCVTGDLPFDSEGVGDLLIKISVGAIPVPSDTLKSLPPAFDAWFAKACERDLDKRFQTAREMALALAGVAGMDTVKKPSMRPPPMGAASAGPAARQGSTPFLDEDEFEEVVDAKPKTTMVDPTQQPGAHGGGPRATPPSKPRPKPPLRGDVTADGEQPVPLVVRAAHEPAPSSRRAPASGDDSVSSARPVVQGSTVDGLARSRTTRTDPPPELDGTKRRRLTTWFIAIAAIAIAAVVGTVVRSQLTAVPAASGEPVRTPGPEPIEAPVQQTEPLPTLGGAPTATATAPIEQAVDPGKLKHPPKATPTAVPGGRRGRFKPRRNDGTVEIPDNAPDDE